MLVKNNTTITILILTVILILVFGCSAIAQKGKCNGKNKPCPTITPTPTPTVTPSVTPTPSPTVVPETPNAPAFPAVFINTEIVQQSGNEVVADSDFQQALNQAVPGDTILLDSGKTYVAPSGGFILPEKPNPDNKWIYIKTKGAVTLEHERIKTDLILPKILTSSVAPALVTQGAASYYRFIGVEFSITENAVPDDTSGGDFTVYNIINVGSDSEKDQNKLSSNIIFDRCYIHGLSKKNVRRGIALNSRNSAIIDSVISEIHEHGADSQAIASWNSPGALKINNNYLEAAGENLLLGGSDAAIQNLVPSDIEIRWNYFYKPLKWNFRDASFDGSRWSVKNVFELKNAQRVLVEGNTLENHWVESQSGASVLFTPRNQDGTNPWAVVQDVVFINNTIKNVAAGFNILGYDYNAPSKRTSRITIKNNFVIGLGKESLGGNGRVVQISDSPTGIFLENNTVESQGAFIVLSGNKMDSLIVNNNLTSSYGIWGDATREGTLTLKAFVNNFKVENNAFVGLRQDWYPINNYYPQNIDDVGFVDYKLGNWKLSESSLYYSKNIGAR